MIFIDFWDAIVKFEATWGGIFGIAGVTAPSGFNFASLIANWVRLFFALFKSIFNISLFCFWCNWLNRLVDFESLTTWFLIIFNNFLFAVLYDCVVSSLRIFLVCFDIIISYIFI